MRQLINKVAIVTGASSGIGQATALALAQEGVHVALVARREAKLQTVAQSIQAARREAIALPTDVTQPNQVEQVVNQTLERWGSIDIVIANAGVYVRCPVAELTASIVEQSMTVNFYGALHLVLAALPHLRAQRSGHIVLVASMDGKKGLPPDAPYVAAKFAMAGFGDVLRQELHGTGVDVSILFPGRIDTPMIGSLGVPWISAKVPPEAVALAVVRAIKRRQAEVIVPYHARFLMYANWLSPRLGDWAVRFFKLEGWEGK